MEWFVQHFFSDRQLLKMSFQYLAKTSKCFFVAQRGGDKFQQISQNINTKPIARALKSQNYKQSSPTTLNHPRNHGHANKAHLFTQACSPTHTHVKKRFHAYQNSKWDIGNLELIHICYKG